jgi:hypothetical protein
MGTGRFTGSSFHRSVTGVNQPIPCRRRARPRGLTKAPALLHSDWGHGLAIRRARCRGRILILADTLASVGVSPASSEPGPRLEVAREPACEEPGMARVGVDGGFAEPRGERALVLVGILEQVGCAN